MPAGRLLLAALAVTALAAGCGGSEPAARKVDPKTIETTAETETTGPPSLGCDVISMCLPAIARETLERCPASRLNARGRAARRRVEKLVPRIADVDLHNERAYEASDAAMAALAELEQTCS